MSSFQDLSNKDGHSDESPRLVIPDAIESPHQHSGPPSNGGAGYGYGPRGGRAGYGYADGGESRQRALREYIHTIIQFKWLILACAVIGLLFGYHLRTKQVLLYESAALVSIGSYVPPTDGPTADALKFETSRGEYLENLIPILKSYSLARKVLVKNSDLRDLFSGVAPVSMEKTEEDAGTERKIGDDSETSEADEASISVGALDGYIGSISLFRQEGTSLLSITATSSNRSMVARISNAHAEAFMEAVRKQRFVWAMTNVEFLKKRLVDEQRAASEAESKMVSFARSSQIDLSGTSRALDHSANRIDSLQSGLNEAIVERITGDEAVSSVRRSNGSDGVYFSTDTAPVLPSLKRLETERERLRRIGAPNYQVESIDNEIRNIRNFIKQASQNALREAQSKARVAREKERSIRKEVDIQRKTQTSRAEQLVQFSVLEKDYKNRSEAMEKTLSRLEEAMVNAESDQKTVQLIDAALTPNSPIVGKRISSLVSGALLGMILGFALAFFIEYHRGAVRTVSDVQTLLDLPMLGVVPTFSRELLRDLDRVKILPLIEVVHEENESERPPEKFSCAFEVMLRQDSPLVSERLNSDGSRISSLAVTLKPHSRESEAFRNLRAALKFCSRTQPPRKVLFTSGQKGDGKTTLCVNLAASIAQTCARTLIIDADLRMPTVHEYFHYTREHRGLGDYLRSPGRIADFIQKTDIDYLSVIVAGSVVSNPAELIGSRRMLDLIEQVSEEFDYVFIDTPPVGEIADALLICQAVDGCVLVARSGETPRAAMQLAYSRLNQVRARVLGTALNGLSDRDGQSDGYYGRYTYGAAKAKA